MDTHSHTSTIPAKHEMDRINTLLRSNYGSYTPDPECISQCLSNTEREMRRNADEIRRLEAQIASIQIEQRGLELRVSRYRSLLAPIRRLPPEVLDLVFKSFCDKLPATFSSILFSPAARLSSVCAGWRDLVRRTPTLWSSLRIEHGTLKHVSLERIVSLLAMHFELSQQAPLDLCIIMGMRDWEERDLERYVEPARVVLEMLLAQSLRWRDVTLALPNFISNDDLAVLRGKLPRLRLLNFLSLSDLDADAFEMAPSLKVLLCSTNLKLPWAQILDLTVRFNHPKRIVEVLTKATAALDVKLSRCTLFNIGVAGVELQASPLVHNLTSFSIMVNQEYPDFHHWFKWLTLPNLTSLDVAGYESSLPVACTSVFENNCFPSFLSRSSCTITSLSLINLPLSESDAMALLTALPSLSSLTIHERTDPQRNTTLTSTFFNSLTIKHNTTFSNSHSLPLRLERLRSLDLRVHGAFPAKVIVDVIVSRWSGNDLEYSAAVGVDSLMKVKILALRSEGAMVLDVQELHDSLEAYKGLGLSLYCESKFLGGKGKK
ncbi:hypothetical protein D9758_003511 [Tetrapyrgos nigripes]|uniref:F-box domain-containing protein n=1 Tax=Tetrapyrgos nigripes TaxID=182062 RepID=A0A8H5GVE3_9AGAR|nr:hypothetical protein D9758_003511 [Tetrapyrgos nigripes]